MAKKQRILLEVSPRPNWYFRRSRHMFSPEVVDATLEAVCDDVVNPVVTMVEEL